MTGFLTGTILGSGWEAKCYFDDIVPFNEKWKPDWKNYMIVSYNLKKIIQAQSNGHALMMIPN